MSAVAAWLRRDGNAWAVLAGTMMLVAGFGVVGAFWSFGHWPRDVPGFWTFRTPNLGDGLLLPTAASLLVAAAHRLPRARLEWLIVAAASLLGTVGGVAEQFAWMSDPDPQLNWTVPAPHTFNSPGIYHAVFLSLASGFFSGTLSLVLYRARALRKSQPEQALALLRSSAAAVLIGSLFSFVGFVVLDGLYVPGFAIRQTTTNLSATLAALVAFALGALVLLWSFGPLAIRARGTLLWGVALALALCLVSWDITDLTRLWAAPDGLALALICVAVGLYGWKLELTYWLARVLVADGVLIGGIAQCRAIAETSLNLALLAALAVVIAAGFAIGMLRSGEARQVVAGTAFPVLVLAFWMWLSHAAHQERSVHLVVPLLSLAWPAAIYAGVRIYVNLVKDEHRYGSGFRAEQSYWVIHLALLCLLITIAIVSVALVGLPGAVLNIGQAEQTYPQVVPMLLGGLGLGIALALAAGAGGRRRRTAAPPLPKWPEQPTLQVSLASTLMAVLAALIWAAAPWLATLAAGVRLDAAQPADLRLPIFIVGAAYALWLGLVTIDSIHANIASFEFYRYTGRAWAVSCAAGAAVISTVAWLCVVGVWSAGQWASYVSLLKVIALGVGGCMTIVPLCARVLERAKLDVPAHPRYLSLHHPATQVFNDQIMHGFSLAATIFGVYAVDHVVLAVWASVDPAALVVQVLVIVAPVLVILLPAFQYVIAHTAEHVEFERRRSSASMLARALGDEEDMEQLRATRAKLIEHRFDAIEGVALPISPFGLIARISQALQSLLG